jgi:spermidine synthase
VTGCLVGADTLDRSTTAWNHPDLIATRDTPYCRVTVTEAGDRLAVFLDDALAYDSEGTAAEEFVHLAALQHEDPGSVLLLGGGGEGLLGEILQHGPLRVDYLELDPVLLGLLAERLPRQLGQPLAAPAVHTFLGDPRRLLARGLPPGQEGGHARLYDLILVGMPEPSSARANRYYTEEFFRVCRRRLRPGGILALRLRAADNLWTGPLVMRTATITHALAAVFSRVLLLPGTTAIILATDAVLPGPQTLAARLQERTITARLVSPPYLAYLYGNDRFEGINALVARTSVEANTDRHPVCYRYSQLLWLSRFLPGRVLRIATLGIDALPPRWRGPATGLVALVLLVGVLGSLLLARRRQIWRRSLLVALAALAGMILETVVLLHYQVRSGVLFQDLGLLLTAFMAGLWLGAAILDRLSARRRAGALDAAGVAAGNIPSSRAAGARGPGRMGGAMLVGAIAVLALAVAGLASGYPAETSLSGAATDLLVSCVMLAACGFLVAAILARASLPGGRARRPEPQQEQQRMVSPLYGADLLGGAVGSLLAGLVLVPVLGLPATALMAGGASLLGLLLI